MKHEGLILTSLLSLFSLIAAPVAADAYRPGDGFQTGGVYFHVVSLSPDGGALFRAGERLQAADGLEEHPGCYRVGRAFYHQEACPVLQAHFARHGAAADSAPPPATATGSAYGAGDHPVDYLRGSYVEPERSYDWGYAGLYYGPWIAPGAGRGGFGGRPGLGFRDARGPFGHKFGRGFVGARAFGFTFRGW